MNVYFMGGLIQAGEHHVDACASHVATLLQLSTLYGTFNVVSALVHVKDERKGLQYC